MVGDHAALGVGLGSWQHAYPEYDRGEWITDNAAPQRPHNDLLWILSETGTVGLALYLWTIGAVLHAAYLTLTQSAGEQRTMWAIGIAVGILALVGHSLFSFPRERVAPSMMFWLGIGCVGTLTSASHRKGSVRGPTALVTALLGVCVLLGGLVLTYRHIHFDRHYLGALSAWRQNDWARAAAEGEKALAWGPLNHRALLVTGLAFHKLGDFDAAVGAYTAAQRYHPNDGHAALAAVYGDLGRHDLAQAHHLREQELYPMSYKPALGLARSLAEDGQGEAAIAAFRDAIDKGAPFPEAELGLADTYRSLKQWSEAASLYREILVRGSPSADSYAKLGQSLQSLGEPEEALEAHANAARLAPDDPRSHNNLGAAYARLHRHAEAEDAYRRALAIDPGYARVHHNLGDLYAAQGKASEAASEYEAFLSSWQGDPAFLGLVKRKLLELGADQ